MINALIEVATITGGTMRAICWDARSADQHTPDCIKVVLGSGRLLHTKGRIIQTWKDR